MIGEELMSIEFVFGTLTLKPEAFAWFCGAIVGSGVSVFAVFLKWWLTRRPEPFHVTQKICIDILKVAIEAVIHDEKPREKVYYAAISFAVYQKRFGKRKGERISILITDAVELAGHGDRVSAAEKLHEAVFLIVG